MNTKRIIFWSVFLVILALIVWGLAVAMKKSANAPVGLNLGTPASVTVVDHIRGPENAKVTLLEYSDFQCPACQAYYPLISRIMDEASTSLRLVYRHYPLPQHANAFSAAVASEAAAVQGKFWEMYDLLFATPSDWTEESDPTPVFVRYAGQIGLNVSQFTNDLASSTLKDKVTAQKNEGIKLGINATPTFFINGKAIANPQGYEPFKQIIDSAIESSTN